MSQVFSEPTKKDALLDLLFVKREGFLWDVMVSGCLGQRDDNIVVFKIFSAMRKRDKKSCYPGLQESKFKAIHELFNRLSWKSAFEGLETLKN